MHVVYPCCAGLDVHKTTVVACLHDVRGGRVHRETRTFGTTTDALLALADWLTEVGCTHVAMESTGVYWKPVHAVLEGSCGVVLVNAQHLKAVPGRKTDVKDAEWLAELLQHGLVRGSFVPPRPQRDLRELTRHRATLVRERSRVVNRLQKLLEDANLKLGDVLSDVLGQSGRAMLRALAAGETDPHRLAALAHPRVQASTAALVAALTGHVRPVHRFLFQEHLDHVEQVDAAITRVSAAIAEALRPFVSTVELLSSIPGIRRRTAEVLLAEIGTTVDRFATAGRLASWAGMCPGQNESAGKRRSGRTRKGSPWLRQALTEAAHGAALKRGSYLRAQFRRLAARRGTKRAYVALGHTLLVIVFHMLRTGQPYQDLGPDHFDRRDQRAIERNLVRRLERLGYNVSLTPAA